MSLLWKRAPLVSAVLVALAAASTRHDGLQASLRANGASGAPSNAPAAAGIAGIPSAAPAAAAASGGAPAPAVEKKGAPTRGNVTGKGDFLKSPKNISASQDHLSATQENELIASAAGWPGLVGWLVALARLAEILGVGTAHAGISFPLLVICAAVVCMLIVIGCGVFLKRMHKEEDDENKIFAELDLDKWKEEADKGSLDLYTVIALSSGSSKSIQGSSKYMARLLTCTIMQVVLCIALLVCQSQDGRIYYYPTRDGHWFRFIGAVLFVYSAYNLGNSMHDYCRDSLLRHLSSKNASGWYEWPLLWGEIMNTIVGVLLMFILFFIFCETQRPASLLMNCIAVNFVADIDNEFVGEEDTEEAYELLKVANIEWEGDPDEYSCKDVFQEALFLINQFVRWGIGILAVIFTLVFAFGNDEGLCEVMKDTVPWPFCMGIAH